MAFVKLLLPLLVAFVWSFSGEHLVAEGRTVAGYSRSGSESTSTSTQALSYFPPPSVSPPLPPPKKASPPPPKKKSPPPPKKKSPPPPNKKSPPPPQKKSPPPPEKKSPPPPKKKSPPPPKKSSPPPSNPPPSPPPPTNPPPSPPPPTNPPPSSPPPPRVGFTLPKQTTIPYFSTIVKNSKVSGIHSALTVKKTVLLIDRTDSLNSQIRLPNKQWAYAAELTLKTNGLRGLDVLTNTFCSVGQRLPDGTTLSIGGSSKGHGNALANGISSIRAFTPCSDGHCDFRLIGNLTTGRWYSAAQFLPDGRIIIIGGVSTTGNILINNKVVNAPTYEFHPRPRGEGNFPLKLLEDTVPFNLYPLVHLLPSGYLFIFAARSSIVFDYINHRVVTTLPDYGPPGVYRNYPVTGTSFLLPLDPSNGYKAEVVICGGNSGTAYNNPKVQATADCGRIAPDSDNPTWESDTMPFPRLMLDSVVLVDGTVLIINGAQYGFQQLTQVSATTPTLQPVLYDPKQPLGQRWQKYPAATKVARMYHSTALLLPDATVMLSGSNPNAKLTRSGPFPTEFRIERFSPHYLHTGAGRPKLISTPASATYNDVFQVTGSGTNSTAQSTFSVALINEGFSTHSQRYGMRLVRLQTILFDIDVNGTFTASVVAPPSPTIAPPGFYWLHVLDNGVPNVEGALLSITST